MTHKEKLATVQEALQHLNLFYKLLLSVTPEVYEGKVDRAVSRCEDLVEEAHSRILQEIIDDHEQQRGNEKAVGGETDDPR